MKDFGRYLRDEIEQRGISRRQLALRMKKEGSGKSYNNSTIARDLRLRKRWNAAQVRRYCDALGIPVRVGLMMAGLEKAPEFDAPQSLRQRLADGLRHQRLLAGYTDTFGVEMMVGLTEGDLAIYENKQAVPDAALLYKLALLYRCSLLSFYQGYDGAERDAAGNPVYPAPPGPFDAD